MYVHDKFKLIKLVHNTLSCTRSVWTYHVHKHNNLSCTNTIHHYVHVNVYVRTLYVQTYRARTDKMFIIHVAAISFRKLLMA